MNNVKNMPESSKKSGAVIGGWICLTLGLLILWKSVWLVIFYGPLFAVSLILGIVALSQGRKGQGLGIILTAVIAVPAIWGFTTLVRSAQAIEDTSAWMEAHPPPNWQQPVAPIKVEVPPNVKSDSFRSSPEVQAPAEVREPVPTKPEAQKPPPSSNVNTTTTVIAPQTATPSRAEVPIQKFADLLSQDLTQADARSLQVAHIEKLPANVNIEVTPQFSNDGKKLAFVDQAQPGRLPTISIFDLATFTVTRKISPSEFVYKLCWSPDDSKLFYVASQGANHVIDISTDKDLSLPIQDGSLNHTVRDLRWPSSDKVIAAYSEPYVITLNLDSLKTQVEHSDRDKVANLFRSSRSHSNAFITSQDLSRLGGDGSYLVVKNNDDTAITPLVANVREDAWYVVEPSLHTVLLLARDEVRVVFIKLKEPGLYRWEFSLPEQPANSELAKYLNKGVPFRAKVFAPAVNPLNGKMVGIDRQRFKGWVLITEWRGMTDVVAVSRIEFDAITEGDIVAEIKSDQSFAFGNHPFDFGDYWTPISRSQSSGASHIKITPHDSVLEDKSGEKALATPAKKKTDSDQKPQAKDQASDKSEKNSNTKSKGKAKEDSFRESVRRFSKF